MNKSNCFKCLCVAIAMFFAGFGLQAQELEFSGYFNGFLPVAQFNDAVELMPSDNFTPINRTNIATGASAGIGATLRVGMWLDVGAGNGLLPFAECSFLWNSTKSKYRDIYDKNELNGTLQATPEIPNYFNVPILIGLKYRYDFTDIIRPFAEASIGFDVMLVSSNGYRGVTYEGIDNYMHYTYKLSGAMAWTVGAGTYLGENVSVGLYFIDLGSHRMEYASRSYRDSDDNSFSVEKRRIGELALRIGFHF